MFTDTFELQIDLDGGDIVRLSLPKFLKELDVTSDPFVMLDTLPGRVYVAQSGLIGRDGIDNVGRADYQASATSYHMTESDKFVDCGFKDAQRRGCSNHKAFRLYSR